MTPVSTSVQRQRNGNLALTAWNNPNYLNWYWIIVDWSLENKFQRIFFIKRLYFHSRKCNWKLWWRHQMVTFSALLARCEGNPPDIGGFPSQRPVTRSFDIFSNVCLNKWLSKQFWWFNTPWRSLWSHCNVSSEICRISCVSLNGLDKMTDILETKFVKAFSWKNYFAF